MTKTHTSPASQRDKPQHHPFSKTKQKDPTTRQKWPPTSAPPPPPPQAGPQLACAKRPTLSSSARNSSGKSPWYAPPLPWYAPACDRLLSRTRKQSFEHVLANINKLNRSLEAVITVCPPSFPLPPFPHAVMLTADGKKRWATSSRLSRRCGRSLRGSWPRTPRAVVVRRGPGQVGRGRMGRGEGRGRGRRRRRVSMGRR